jgi:hypothetical protein
MSGLSVDERSDQKFEKDADFPYLHKDPTSFTSGPFCSLVHLESTETIFMGKKRPA